MMMMMMMMIKKSPAEVATLCVLSSYLPRIFWGKKLNSAASGLPGLHPC